ncbi:retrovirus-related pol polyprotein from transposon TNT 1-94 [Tanacetum coccineum]|uniref:Retrovirus-related pol polyprotein from transposon TNT 1-94 n=1 Tax=Tanacetum coccineum TaxID=301880 RepID=A0ABQ5EID4_9ASTR
MKGRRAKGQYNTPACPTTCDCIYVLHVNLERARTLPTRVQSINGKKYILVIVDDYSRFTWVKFLRSKDETPIFVINLLKQLQVGLNKTIQFVRTDNGTKFVNKNLTDYCESVGITHEKTVPRTPQQNGVVERRNHTLVEAARTMLIFSKAPLFLWAEAVATACYTQNRSLIHTLHNKTPYELVHDKKLDLSFLLLPTKQWKPTGRLLPLGRQCPLVRSTALKSDCLPADPQETIAPVAYNLVVQIVLWYLDSGCSKHMTGDRSRLRNFVKKFIGTVRFGNDHFGAIMGYGDYVIGDSVISRNYPPSCCYALLHPKPIPYTYYHNKTPYELVHDKKPDLSFLRIFGALCYLTNDSEDLGKLKAKADIGFFVGLVPNSAPAIPYVPPTNKDLELLFQPMFDEYFETPTGDHQMPLVPAVPPPVIPTVNPFAATEHEPFVNVFAPDPNSEASSLGLHVYLHTNYYINLIKHSANGSTLILLIILLGTLLDRYPLGNSLLQMLCGASTIQYCPKSNLKTSNLLLLKTAVSCHEDETTELIDWTYGN